MKWKSKSKLNFENKILVRMGVNVVITKFKIVLQAFLNAKGTITSRRISAKLKYSK